MFHVWWVMGLYMQWVERRALNSEILLGVRHPKTPTPPNNKNAHRSGAYPLSRNGFRVIININARGVVRPVVTGFAGVLHTLFFCCNTHTLTHPKPPKKFHKTPP
jgi:hypothetical protein